MGDVSPEKETLFESLTKMCMPRTSERCEGSEDFFRCKEIEMNKCVEDFCKTFVCGGEMRNGK